MLLLIVVVSTQIAHASSHTDRMAQDDVTATPTPAVPTVTVFHSTAVAIPTVAIPLPTATPTATATPKPKRIKKRHKKPATPPARKVQYAWILAYLTSYCPGSAGWLSSSGMTVFYGMLANNYYTFGTRVYIPVIGITGVVEDRLGAGASWDHFDVWSAVCYSTPTGWFRVGIES